MFYIFFERGNFIDFKRIHQGDTSTRNVPGLCRKCTQPIKSLNITRYTSDRQSYDQTATHEPVQKKILDHLCQEMRCHYKDILCRRPLQDSPRTEPMCRQVDNLQKGKLFVIENHRIFAGCLLFEFLCFRSNCSFADHD